MIILSNNDLYKVRTSSLVADYDKNTIVNLYQPIIGAVASALYFYLLTEIENQKITGAVTHEQLLLHMQLSTSEFLKARKNLEAVGLIKTFLNGYDEVKNYEYILYAPKTPTKFFEDTLLFGTLIHYIGEGNANRLRTIYRLNTMEPVGNEVSATFGEIFHPDFDDPSYKEALRVEKSLGRKTAKIDSEFSYDAFFDALSSISLIKKESITKKEMKEIERLSTLYGVDVINTASLVSNVYEPTNPKGTRVDMKKLSILLQNEVNYRFLSHKKVVNKTTGISSDTDLAQKITLMEKSSPKDFLMALQNGTQAAGADLRLIEDLAMKFKLTNGVINVLVEYTLSTNNNVLSRAYIEKVAASLVREGITTALDAMNYLRDINKKAKQSKQNKTVKTRNTIIKAEEADLDIEPVKDTTDEAFDWEALVKEIDG